MKVIKKISNYIDSLDDMADKPWYSKIFGWIVAFFISTSLVWLFLLVAWIAEKYFGIY